MPEEYGFSIKMTGDAAKKLAELGVTITQTSRKAEKSGKGMSGIFGEITREVKSMASAFAVGSLAVAGIEKVYEGVTEIMKESSKEYLDGIKNFEKLRFAIEDVAKEGTTSFEKLIDTASKSKLFSDDSIMNAARYFSQIGLTSGAIDEILPKLQDFAIATGMDMEEAAQTMSKGILGNAKAVRMYGIDVAKTATAEQNLSKIMEALEKRHGAQESYMKTAAGQIQKLNVDLEKQAEIIGKTTTGWDIFWLKLKKGTGYAMATMFGGKGEIDAASQKAKAEEQVAEILSKGGYAQPALYKKAAEEFNKYRGAIEKYGDKGIHLFTASEEEAVEAFKYIELYKKITEHYQNIGKSSEKIRKDSELAESDMEKRQENLVKIRELQLKYAADIAKLNEDTKLNKLLEIEADRLEIQKDLNELKKLGGAVDQSLLKSAYQSSLFTGPTGGLSAAKVVNINIDTVQKNDVTATDKRDFLDTSKQAVEVIIRELNNIALSQSATM